MNVTRLRGEWLTTVGRLRLRYLRVMNFESHALAVAMARSYKQLTGEDLVEGDSSGDIGDALYEADELLLCHDGATDPLFTYANRAAQRVFELEWNKFIGMPSRLSAAPDAQADRNELIVQATESGFFTGYSGVRVSSSGRKFEIQDAVLWRVTDEAGSVLGLACRVPSWRWMD